MPLWTLLLTLAIGFPRIHISSASGIIEARCKINCLSTVQPQISNTSISNCESNSNCSSCLIPCSFEYKSRRLCETSCKSAPDVSWCLESCHYLKLITHQHNGRCPPLEALSGFQKACVDACSDDAGCKSGQKCCSNGCGHTCQQAVVQSDDYPPRPQRERISVEENDDASSVTIGWLPRKPPDPGEILAYAVQGRNHSGENLKKKLMGSWHTISVTQFLKANIGLSVGRFYQFRVASVNINGSRGYSRMTPAFKLSRNPSQPSPPRHIKKVRSVLRPDGTVDVVISWDPPEPSDLELLRFRIFWSERPETSPTLMRIEEFRKSVVIPTTSCELIGLKQNTKYFIQVQSVALWGEIRKFSERIGTLIRVENFDDSGSADVMDIPYFLPHSSDSPGPVEEIHHGRTYWRDNNLKNDITWRKPLGYESRVGRFTVHWKPIQCFNRHDQGTHEASVRQAPSPQSSATAEDTSFTIYDLTFDCMYLVWVVPVSTDELLGQAAYISFTTPPCSEVRVLDNAKPVCPTAAPDLPSAPVNVSHMFIIQEGGSIAVNISWAPPLHHLDGLTGYRIVSTEYKPHPPNFYRHGFPVLDSSYTRTVGQYVNYIILDGVDAGMRYFVTVSATNTIGGGDLAVLDIKTPIVTMPMHPIPPTAPQANIKETEIRADNSLTTEPNPGAHSSGLAPSKNVRLICMSLVLWCTLHFRWR